MFSSFIDTITQGFWQIFVEQFSVWVAIGFIGQVAFMSRFLVQWLASEKAGRSYIPVGFWYLSIVGGIILLIYAISRRDPVFIAGQSFGIIVYVRNLMLLHRERTIKNE